MKKIKKTLKLEDGTRIILVDFLDCEGPLDDIHRNVFRVDSNTKIVWQIGEYNPFPNSTFTNIYFQDNKLFGYNFDGGEYEIDSQTGKINSSELIK